MTEEEAKTKWCPFVRHYNAMFQPCGNSLAGVPPRETPVTPFTCIASACMAWRKALAGDVGGYCGLAGKP